MIGVEKYDDVNIPPLTGPANDVEQMKEGLETYAGFDEGNIFVLTTSPAANTPTRSHILTSLSRIRNMVPTNGLLLFMFSGHGVSKGDIAYLLPSDAHQTDDVELLADTALPIDLIRQRIAATGVKQAIVFLDACRNGLESSKGEGDNPLTKAFKDEFDFSRLNKEIEASVVVYATALGSRAWIDNDKHLGYFTEAITSGLSGKAADSQGRVTLRTLLDYVQSSVPQMVARDLGPSKEQKPFFELSGYKPAELVIAQTNALSTIKEGSITATPSIDPRMPIPPNASALDFESLFKQYGNDEIPLLNLGSAAFVRANYEWTIRYLERARAIWQSGIDYSHHGAWTIGYPYLAAAYLFGQNDEVKFRSTIDEMMGAMRTPYSGLNTEIAIKKVVRNLEKIRAFMPPSDSEVVDKAIDQA
ncbi:MAG: caspase family protein, partial [Candidatus Sulfotelmatobacter sp.]